MTFQQKVLNKIKSIPRGKVTTYKALAQSLNSKAYRAVGQACKNNPNPFTTKKKTLLQKTTKTKNPPTTETPTKKRTPCHRVIPSSGKVGNYNQGQKKKIELLKKEGIKITKGRVCKDQILPVSKL